MSPPTPQRRATAQPPVELDLDPQRPSADGVRLRWGRWEIAARGASAVYAVCLAACIAGLVYLAPPLISSIRETTEALHETATTIRAVAEDARAARAAVGRLEAALPAIESRLQSIETDVGALRSEIRACRRDGR